MKKVLIITDIDFWKGGAGHRTRVQRLSLYLSKYSSLAIAYTKFVDDTDKLLIKNLAMDFTIIFLNEKGQLSNYEMGEHLHRLVVACKFDSCIMEYIHNSFFLKFIPDSVTTFLDTNDIVSQRNKSLGEIPGMEKISSESLSAKQEIKIYDCYDFVMFICEPDFSKIKSLFPARKMVLVPHACDIKTKQVRHSARNIGFVASEYIANIDGIQHFINNCWPLLLKENDLELVIFGNIAKRLSNIGEVKNVIIKGYMADIKNVYENIDVAINPIRYGGGIKIKSLEALSHQTPLVTTSHGARGIEQGIGSAFLVADEPVLFATQIMKLVGNYTVREKIARRGLEFVMNHFSDEKCYEPLIRLINQN